MAYSIIGTFSCAVVSKVERWTAGRLFLAKLQINKIPDKDAASIV